MVKGIVNAFDQMGLCLILNLTTTCTDASGRLYGHQTLLPSMLKYLLPAKKLISNTGHTSLSKLQRLLLTTDWPQGRGGGRRGGAIYFHFLQRLTPTEKNWARLFKTNDVVS